IDGITGEEDTYGSLLRRCVRTAITMQLKGITPDDIIILCTHNHLDTFVPYFAALFIGAKVSALDPSLSVKDTVHLLKQVTPKMIFATPESVPLMEESSQEVSGDIEIVVFGKTDKHTNFSEFLLPKPEEDQFKPTEPKSLFDTALIFFSSGTTGLPKGICINHYTLLGQVLNFINFGFTLDRTLLWSSIYWTTSIFCLGALYLTGATRILLPRFNLQHVYNAIEKCKPTLIASATSQFYEISRDLPSNVDISSVKQIIIGGTSLIEKQVLKMRETFSNADIYNCYGQTELALFITIFRPCNKEENALMLKKPTSCGWGIPGISYKVVDPETEEILGANQPGELRLKTKYVLNGYYKQDSSHIWDDDGWYKTGDIVYYDDDLCFYVVDRIKEMLKYRAWHVPPAVIEACLLSHPAIANAVVIGIPHELDGDHPMAIIVLKDSYKNISTEEIHKYVEERLDDNKKLRGGIKIVEFIPTNGTGKIQRRNIKNMVLRGEL
ncbi:hypothetical protein ILUMI_21415, partial [Ignelater luminosus]